MSSKADRSHRLERATAFLMGISLAGGGLQALSGGKRWITNYLSIPIPSAAALAAGAVVAVGALTLPIRPRRRSKSPLSWDAAGGAGPAAGSPARDPRGSTGAAIAGSRSPAIRPAGPAAPVSPPPRGLSGAPPRGRS